MVPFEEQLLFLCESGLSELSQINVEQNVILATFVPLEMPCRKYLL